MLLTYLLLFLMIFLWGFSFIAVDIAMDFVPPLSIALYRLLIAAISMTIVDWYLRKKNKPMTNSLVEGEDENSNKQYWLFIFLASLAGVSLYLFIIYSAIDLIGPSIPVFSDCLINPILITIIALVVFKEKLSKKKIIGFAIASFGAFLLITGGNLGVLQPDSPNFLGYILSLLAPLSWTSYTIVIKKLKKFNRFKSDFQNLKNISILGCLELFLLVILSNQFDVFLNNVLNVVVFLCALYLALGAFVIGYYIWNFSLKKLKSSNVASFLYLQPFLTLILSIIFQRDDVIGLWNIFGGIVVIVAIMIINYKKQILTNIL